MTLDQSQISAQDVQTISAALETIRRIAPQLLAAQQLGQGQHQGQQSQGQQATDPLTIAYRQGHEDALRSILSGQLNQHIDQQIGGQQFGAHFGMGLDKKDVRRLVKREAKALTKIQRMLAQQQFQTNSPYVQPNFQQPNFQQFPVSQWPTPFTVTPPWFAQQQVQQVPQVPQVPQYVVPVNGGIPWGTQRPY